jgi:hypothetical protein
VHLPDSMGLPLIAYLLQNPQKDIFALDLEIAVRKRPMGKIRGMDELSGDLIDDVNGTGGLALTNTGSTLNSRELAKTDLEGLKNAIAHLEKQRDETENVETEKHLQNQIDILKKELARKTNNRGKARPSELDQYEKARIRVIQKIQTVREILKKDHKKLYDHFERELKVASECCYNPIPPVKWEFFNL